MGCLNSKRTSDDDEDDFKSSKEKSGRTPRRVQTPASHDTDAWGAPVPMRPKAKSGPVTSTGGPVIPKLKPVTASGPLPRSAAGSAKIDGNNYQGVSPNIIVETTLNIRIPRPTQPKPVFQLQPKAKAHSRTSKSGVLYQHTPFSKIPPEGGIPEVIVDVGNNSPHSDQYLPPCGSRVVKVATGNYELHYSVLSQRGHYPDAMRKANQDTFAIHTSFGGDPNEHFFGVFDGHGEYGQHCSHFARKNLCKNLQNDSHYPADVVQAYHSAFLATNSQLHNNNQVDDSMSGTTGISILVRGRKLYVANVGDSRAVLAVRRKGEKKLQAKDLSFDQTPYRADECARVRSCGARVMTLDQLEGLKDPNVQCWDAEGHDDGDPPRLWVANGMYPGTAFTRSIGDTVAEEIGVTAVPEVLVMELRPRHPFFVIASDGVFEFLSSQDVVDMVGKYQDPRDACVAVVEEAYRVWLKYETRTDDITVIVVHIDGLRDNKSQKSPSADMQPTQIVPSNPPLSEDELEPSKKPRPVRTSSSVRRVSEAANDFEAPCAHAELQPKTSRKEAIYTRAR